ncbi:DUF2024 family protein [Flavobacterium selenitireducens]|uniref:DUF2024 family protein n=1 Tax=Flavobacterium selenitireducens TaxID=2722704 RepID=UPI00168A9553|nr:DUF2024 family protein [Flavobacterium selenitireducens]MBD3582210.1 DUF2024 family protein [Flavobacterium selenitireducens]
MKVAVWDTYVTRNDGSIMHFDIVVPDELKDENIIHTFGQQYLAAKGQNGLTLNSEECRYCHIEVAPPPVVDDIERQGYYIVEMENCN